MTPKSPHPSVGDGGVDSGDVGVVLGTVMMVVGYWSWWWSSGGCDGLCKGSSCNSCRSAIVKRMLHGGVGGGDGDCSCNGGRFD